MGGEVARLSWRKCQRPAPARRCTARRCPLSLPGCRLRRGWVDRLPLAGRDRGCARSLQQPVVALDRAPGAGRQVNPRAVYGSSVRPSCCGLGPAAARGCCAYRRGLSGCLSLAVAGAQGHSRSVPAGPGWDALEHCYAGTPAGSGCGWLAGSAAACQIRAASGTIAAANGSMYRMTTGPPDICCWGDFQACEEQDRQPARNGPASPQRDPMSMTPDKRRATPLVQLLATGWSHAHGGKPLNWSHAAGG